MNRLVCTGLLLIAAVTVAAPKKPKKPATPPPPVVKACESFAVCTTELNDAFEAGDFERAQRLASRAETMAVSAKEKAQILVLRGALDFQSAAAGADVKDAVRAKFAEAIRLDGDVSVVSIPPFARTDALEALLIEARPKVEPPQGEPPPSPPTLLLTTEPAPVPVRRFPVVGTIFGAAAVASAGVGLFLRVNAEDSYARAKSPMSYDDDRQSLVESARANGVVSTGLWIAAGVSLAAAIVFILLER